MADGRKRNVVGLESEMPPLKTSARRAESETARPAPKHPRVSLQQMCGPPGLRRSDFERFPLFFWR